MNRVKFPITTDELAGLLPHSKPMVWVDRIIDVSTQHGRTAVTLNHHLMLDNGRVHVGALVEFLAQSYAFIMAVEARQRQRRVTVAHLAAIDRFELLSDTLPCEGETLSAELETIRNLDPLFLVRGQVFVPPRRKLCEIEFKAYAQTVPCESD